MPGGREAIRKSLAELGPDEGLGDEAARDLADSCSASGRPKACCTTSTPSSTTIAAVALMFLPGIGIMTWKEAQPKIPWGTIVLFGIGISLGTALLQTKGAVWLADIVVAQFGLKKPPRCSSSA